MLYIGDTLSLQDTSEVKGKQKIYHANSNHKKAGRVNTNIRQNRL